jgi:hypothetical protein
MQYFVRAMAMHKDSARTFGPEVPCAGLAAAKEEAKRIVMNADPALRVQADACSRNRGLVWTKYRCWINERGDFQEKVLV